MLDSRLYYGGWCQTRLNKSHLKLFAERSILTIHSYWELKSSQDANLSLHLKSAVQMFPQAWRPGHTVQRCAQLESCTASPPLKLLHATIVEVESASTSATSPTTCVHHPKHCVQLRDTVSNFQPMNFHLYYTLPWEFFYRSGLQLTTMPWSAEEETTLINFNKGEEPFIDKSPFHTFCFISSSLKIPECTLFFAPLLPTPTPKHGNSYFFFIPEATKR